jgi:UDP-N-acetylglucosamine:LPS N-acetylglucosamine transferase
MPEQTASPKKILAVSSGGGHWVQLKRLLPAFEGQRLSIVTVDRGAASEVECERFYLVNDASLWSKVALVRAALRIAWIMITNRPHVVISTGAAPGFFAILFGSLLGARTIWIDSIANAERLSLSGEKAGRFADLWLTQWPHLERPGGPRYRGSVL